MGRRLRKITTSTIICKNGMFNNNTAASFVMLLTDEYCSRQKRMHDRIRTKTVSDGSYGEIIRTSDLWQHEDMGNDEHTIQDLHDVLQSYYKVALKRFVDNLRMQAADQFLISGPDTPLTLFSPAFVANLTHEELDQAAGEAPQVKRQRALWEKEVQDLEEAMKILR